MPQLDVATYSSQIFWLLTCLVVLYVSLRYIFIPRLENSINARKKRIESLILDAEKLRLESDAMNQKYIEEIAKVHTDAFNLHKQAVAEFEISTAKEFDKLAHAQHLQLVRFREEIDLIHDSMEKSIEKEATKLLHNMIDKVLSSKISASLMKGGRNG